MFQILYDLFLLNTKISPKLSENFFLVLRFSIHGNITTYMKGDTVLKFYWKTNDVKVSRGGGGEQNN